ncbi:ESCRT-0 subunit protein hse1 [Mortierella sp. GBA39]|nr:ESCRT-0 subunit protein hse1 [Mortierella sp. GBA39]
MAEAACSHILQSLQGHVIFLANQGLISDESRAIILGELCNLDLQAISAPSINDNTNSNRNVQYASAKPLTTLHHEPQESRPSIDTELQMLIVPPKSAVVPVSQPTPSPPSSNSNSNSSSNNVYRSTLNHQTVVGRADSESDEEEFRDSDLAHQERLLRQEQNTDIITGELDNLVAASATDLEGSEVGVLEGADEDDEDEEEKTEVLLARSLSSPSQKPELPPLLFSNSHSYDSRPNSFDFSSAPLNNPAQERTLYASNKSSDAVAPLASDAAAAALPQSHTPPSQGSIHSTSNAAVTSPSIPIIVAPAQANQEALSFSTATTGTTSTTTTPVALSPPSSNLERSEQHNSATEHHNFAPAYVSTASPAPAPVPFPASTTAYGAVPVASSVAASSLAHVNAPVTFQHTAPTSTGSVYSPSYSTSAQEQPTIYNPNQAVSPPAPVVYQPPALFQTQQTTPKETPAAVIEEHVATPQGLHGHEQSYSRHLHDASASTAFSNDGKDSMTSLDSGKPSDLAPTPPPKEEYQKPVTYQPPSTQPVQGVSQPAPVGPASSLPDPTLPQSLAMPVQAYQLYQPKPYQPKSKPSVRQPPKQVQPQEAVVSAAAVQPEIQQQQSVQSQPQSQSQSQSQSQPQPQHQEQAQTPFQAQGQSQSPVPGLAHQSPEQQQQQFQHQYHLQQQYQAQQQMQQQQQQQQFFQQQQQQQQQPWAGQHPPIHTGPEVSNVGNSGPPSATSSANESPAASKPTGKGWMSGIRTSFMPKGSKKDSKESKEAKEAKNQHAAQDSPSQIQVAPASLTVQPQAPFGQQQQFEGHPGQYGNTSLQYRQHQQQPPFPGGQAPGQGGYNGANFASPVSGAPGSSPVSQRESIAGATSGSGALPAAAAAPANFAAPGRQDSFQSEVSAQIATPQAQQQPGLQQHFQQQQFQQQQQAQQQQFHQQQLDQQHQSPYATNAVQPALPAVAPLFQQQQQPPASAAPITVASAVTVPDSQGAQANDDKALRRLSSVSNSSFNNASLKPETINAANAASAAIQAARTSTSSASLPGQVKVDSPVTSPYQQQQQQQQQQPMVAQQEQRQQAPGSPLSDAGSRISVQSGASEVLNMEVIARAQAMFDFPGEDPGDLPFKVGDIINVIGFLNDDWWRGTLRKELGIFPTAYVQKLAAPANGAYPKISVTVRQSMVGPSPTEQAGFANSLQQQASFRASYQPSSLEPATSSTSAAGFIPTQASVAAPGPDANAPGGGANFPAPPPTSSPFPTPPPGSSAMSPTASSVFTYFPNSGNQPPISPPPSMRNQNQRLPFAQGQPGQENYGPPGSQPLSPTSPQQNRFSQQPPNMMPFQQQPGQPGQQQQYQQYGQAPYQYSQLQQQQQQQQPLSPTAGGSVGSNSQMTTAQMAAAVKPKKKFGPKW